MSAHGTFLIATWVVTRIVSCGCCASYGGTGSSVLTRDRGKGDCCAGSQVIFRVRRPMYLINSTIIVEDGEGNTVGEVSTALLGMLPKKLPSMLDCQRQCCKR